MAKTIPDVINLKSRGDLWVEDAVATGTITPGSVVQLGATASPNEVAVQSTAAGKRPVWVALHDTDLGRGINDDYVAGDSVKYIRSLAGDEFFALVAASAAAIAKGALLEFDASGGFRILAAGAAKAIALEAVDNSGGGTPARIKVATI